MQTNLKYKFDVKDYDPFGMITFGRSWEVGSEYRYGFGKYELDKCYYSGKDFYQSEFRNYNARMGRWLSLDPLDKKYPNISPYSSFKNNPIYYVDVNGDDILIYCSEDKTTPILRIETDLYKEEYVVTLPEFIDCTLLEKLALSYELDNKGDATLISLDASFAFGGGATGGFSVVFINEGIDKGGVFFYGQAGGTIGLEGGVSLVGGIVDFNESNSEHKSLNRETFEGKSQGITASAWYYSGGSIKSFVDGEWHSNPVATKPDILYECTLDGVGAGAPAGIAFFATEAELLGTIVEPTK